MLTAFQSFGIAITVFVAMDLLWLGVIAKSFYHEQIGSFLRADVNWYAAIVFYCVYALGITIFVVLPSLEKQSLQSALLLGAFLGIVAYSAYDLVLLATMKNWPLTLTIVDLVWGAIITGTVSTVTYSLLRIYS